MRRCRRRKRHEYLTERALIARHDERKLRGWALGLIAFHNCSHEWHDAIMAYMILHARLEPETSLHCRARSSAGWEHKRLHGNTLAAKGCSIDGRKGATPELNTLPPPRLLKG